MIEPVQIWNFDAAPNRAYRVTICGDAPQKAVALIEWCDGRSENNGAFKRVFLTRGDKGWNGTSVAPENATSLRVLVFHWIHLGAPELGSYECKCEEVTLPASRQIRVAVAHQRAPEGATIEGNIALMCEAIRAAGEQGAALLCMTENFPDRAVDKSLDERALTPGDERLRPLFTAIRAANIYAVFTLHEKMPHGIFIAAWLISPTGEIIGRYNKRNLTLSELEMGLSPGTEHGVFDTPIGKIGILICWDAWFPESATELARCGAEIICFPLAGDVVPERANHVWRARALDNQVFLLASCTDNCSRVPSRIIAPDGSVLAETGAPNSLIFADIDFNARVESFWLSVGPYASETRNVYDHSRLD